MLVVVVVLVVVSGDVACVDIGVGVFIAFADCSDAHQVSNGDS